MKNAILGFLEKCEFIESKGMVDIHHQGAKVGSLNASGVKALKMNFGPGGNMTQCKRNSCCSYENGHLGDCNCHDTK